MENETCWGNWNKKVQIRKMLTDYSSLLYALCDAVQIFVCSLYDKCNACNIEIIEK